MATVKERVDRHDREIAAIRKLIQAGMKMIIRAEERSKHAEERFEIETAAAREDMRQIRVAQRETDRLQRENARQLRDLKDAVDRVVKSIQRGEGNGHKSSRIE